MRMSPINRYLQSRMARFVVALFSGGLFYLSLRLSPWWPAIWLALIPLLLAAFHAGAREARLLAWLAASAGVLSNFTYYLQTTGPIAAVIVTVLQLLLWSFFVERTRAAVLASSHRLRVFMLPLLLIP